jgi:ADP-ribosylglycohydrolase
MRRFSAVENLGDDANTTVAISGQFARAYWGESGIPQERHNGLARPEMIEDALQGLLGADGFGRRGAR